MTASVCGTGSKAPSQPRTPTASIALESILPTPADLGGGWIVAQSGRPPSDDAFCRTNIGAGRYVQQAEADFTAAIPTGISTPGSEPIANLIVRVSRLKPGTASGYLDDWASAASTCKSQLASQGVELSDANAPHRGDRSLTFHVSHAQAEDEITLVKVGDLIIYVEEQVLQPTAIDAGLIDSIVVRIVGSIG
jgi:hypothetical protein